MAHIYKHVNATLERKGSMVIVVAEGAMQDIPNPNPNPNHHPNPNRNPNPSMVIVVAEGATQEI